jgi:hypothetical protein
VKTFKVATTAEVLECARVAQLCNYNRQFPEHLELAPDVYHLCYFYMEHYHIHGKPADMHYRSLWKIKLTDTAFRDVVDLQLDWDAKMFEGLQELEFDEETQQIINPLGASSE